MIDGNKREMKLERGWTILCLWYSVWGWIRLRLYSEPSLDISFLLCSTRGMRWEALRLEVDVESLPTHGLQKEYACRNSKCLWVAVLFSIMLSKMLGTKTHFLLTSPHHREMLLKHFFIFVDCHNLWNRKKNAFFRVSQMRKQTKAQRKKSSLPKVT